MGELEGKEREEKETERIIEDYFDYFPKPILKYSSACLRSLMKSKKDKFKEIHI